MSRPYVIHPEDCPAEGWDDPTRGSVRWWTLVSADRHPSDSMVVGIAELPPSSEPDTALSLHWHVEAEVYHILSGSGVVIINAEEHPVRPGATVFIPGDAEHGVRNTGTVPLRLLYVFAADAFDQIKYTFSDP